MCGEADFTNSNLVFTFFMGVVLLVSRDRDVTSLSREREVMSLVDAGESFMSDLRTLSHEGENLSLACWFFDF